MNHVVPPVVSPRIALVSCGLNLGGSTTFLCNFAGELVRRNLPVQVLSFQRNNPLASDFSGQNIPLLCLDERRCIFEDRMSRVLAELRQFRPTVVISTLGSESFEVHRYLPAGVLRVGMAQADDPLIYPGIARYAAHLDQVAVVSPEMKRKMQAQPALARHPVHYLPYGVPMPERPPTRSFGAGQTPLRILYLGRVEREQKRVQLFPQMLDQLKASGIPFHWTVAGDGSEKAALEGSMRSSPSQTVSFPGKIAYAGIPALLREHEVFLLASDYEGLPLSLLEAMGHGLVPVVSDLKSGIPEVVDGTNGLLVPVAYVPGYARAIIHLHEHRDELAAKSAAARERVKNEFSVAAMTDRWLAALPSAVGEIKPWPQRWRIQSLLPARHKWYFSPPVRALRRLVVKFRGLAVS